MFYFIYTIYILETHCFAKTYVNILSYYFLKYSFWLLLKTVAWEFLLKYYLNTNIFHSS